MKIGELAKRSGLSASRIRFYESAGLLTAVERSGNGYRRYGAEVLWMLEIITGAQSAGFSLEEIRSLLPASSGGWQHEELLAGLKRKVAEIEVLQQRLARNKAQLLVAIEGIEHPPAGQDCVGNAQRVLDRLREQEGAQKS
ncbi:MerR family transcriptional regulator [Pseudomonas japonica]|uniref:Transcriptional regulator, MerR family n=1 Tax=Pseudomonas japonica TaxID=256466 RepID=A0A239L4Q7_9PSED|nr:MerR family transcriptional regulator [Pseudomonas japonica]SNT24679.1 transcriptional regulator, MerR family [Pseudomonas japonica]